MNENGDMSAPVERFKISRAAFEKWAQSVFGLPKPPSTRTIAQASKVSRSTVAKQLKNNDVDAQITIEISRFFGLQPLRELSRFPGYEILQSRVIQPSLEESLAVVSFPALLIEVLRRYRWHPEIEESRYPLGVQTWQAWFHTVAPEATLAACQKILDLSVASVSRNHRRGNWNIAQVLTLATNFHINPHMALVASAHLAPEEAGLPATLREDALRQATDGQIQAQLVYLAPQMTELMQRQSEDFYRGLINDYLA